MNDSCQKAARSCYPALAIVVAASIATAAAGVVRPPAVFAAGQASRSTITLSVEQRPDRPTQLRLLARLEGGSLRPGHSVAFFVITTEFERPHNVPIGTAAIDAHGTATIAYKPTWSGNQRFVAKLTGSEAPAATADFRVTASIPGPLYADANPGRPLGSVGGAFLDAILTVVALVWLSLIVVLVLAIARIPRLAGGTD